MELEKQNFRSNIFALQAGMIGMIERGEMTTANMRLKHYFCPTPDGRFIYARELWVAKESVIVGKIHRFPCLNFLTLGKIAVATEEGTQVLTAPYTFVAPAGVKRAGTIIEDTIWTTVHLTEYGSEADLDKIENEVIAPNFAEIDRAAALRLKEHNL